MSLLLNTFSVSSFSVFIVTHKYRMLLSNLSSQILGQGENIAMQKKSATAIGCSGYFKFRKNVFWRVSCTDVPRRVSTS